MTKQGQEHFLDDLLAVMHRQSSGNYVAKQRKTESLEKCNNLELVSRRPGGMASD
jgi:hypothetical protein